MHPEAKKEEVCNTWSAVWGTGGQLEVESAEIRWEGQQAEQWSGFPVRPTLWGLAGAPFVSQVFMYQDRITGNEVQWPEVKMEEPSKVSTECSHSGYVLQSQ